MTQSIHETAATVLAKARLESRPLDCLPESCRPKTDKDALVIQLKVAEVLADRIAGWKCATPRGKNPFLAPLLASTVQRAAPCLIVPSNNAAKIEPEVAYVLGRTIPPRAKPYTVDDVKEAIRETRLVLELIGSRFIDPRAVTFPEFLADSINNQGLFVGPGIAGPDEQLTAFKITIAGPEGILQTHDGVHPNGHPLNPLMWLVNFITGRGETLKPDQIITTGSYAGILEVPLETPLRIQFGGLGEITVQFVAAD